MTEAAARLRALCVLLALAVTGCSSPFMHESPEVVTPIQSALSPTLPAASGDVSKIDPQILSDVIDGAFYLPGPSMRRAMRVSRAADSIIAVDCGGEPFEDVDYTGDRFDQGLFPDVELITEKGLVESGLRPAGNRYSGWDKCRRKSLPSWEDWFDLSISWSEVGYEMLHSAEMRPVLADTAACLREETGLEVDDVEPTNEVLQKMDEYLSGVVDWDKESKRLFAGYAKCVGEYADTMAALLAEPRLEQIERDRELLERFAGELAAAGYVP